MFAFRVITNHVLRCFFLSQDLLAHHDGQFMIPYIVKVRVNGFTGKSVIRVDNYTFMPITYKTRNA